MTEVRVGKDETLDSALRSRDSRATIDTNSISEPARSIVAGMHSKFDDCGLTATTSVIAHAPSSTS